MSIADISDGEIIEALRGFGSYSATYVVRNRLSRKHPNLKTSAVLRRLKNLEARGLVRRVESSYAVMICWAEVTTEGVQS